jgi:lysozyme family protein
MRRAPYSRGVAESSQTYPAAFLESVELVLAAEGGYVNNPSDTGGETKFGISKHSYPKLDIANLTRDGAVAIYFSDFWQKFGLGLLTPRVAAKVFNLGVDMYPLSAIICLQRACRACGISIMETGVVDGSTRNAVESLTIANEPALMAALRSELAAHYRLVAANQGKRDQAFIKGWLARAYS